MEMDMLFSVFAGWMDDMRELGLAVYLRDTFVGSR